ncbi:MAG: ribbon-helix-helix protein, CopG family [Candidatus Dormiibacterota bacterium]
MTSGMLNGMGKVEKVTVSLPAELFTRIEEHRRRLGISRSAEVSRLLLWGWRQVEAEERERRYRAAYGAQPETEEERGLADEAAAELLQEVAEWGRAGDEGPAAR